MMHPNLGNRVQRSSKLWTTAEQDTGRRLEAGSTPLSSPSDDCLLYRGRCGTHDLRAAEDIPTPSERVEANTVKSTFTVFSRSENCRERRQTAQGRPQFSQSKSPLPLDSRNSKPSKVFPPSASIQGIRNGPVFNETYSETLIATPSRRKSKPQSTTSTSSQETSSKALPLLSVLPSSSPDHSSIVRGHPQYLGPRIRETPRGRIPSYRQARTPRYPPGQISLPKQRNLKQPVFQENYSFVARRSQSSESSPEKQFDKHIIPDTTDTQTSTPKRDFSSPQQSTPSGFNSCSNHSIPFPAQGKTRKFNRHTPQSNCTLTDQASLPSHSDSIPQTLALNEICHHSSDQISPAVLMPPGGGHYRPNTGSNPYNNFHGPTTQQTFQHQNTNFHSQGFGGHPGFPNNHSNGNTFGSNLVTGSTFNSNAGLGSMGATGLGSQEVQMRFTHGGNLQQHHMHEGIGTAAVLAKMSRIREVWSHNFAAEIATIRELVDRYPYVSMDTEFPGVVGRPMGNFSSKADYHYQTLRVNVDMLKLIRLGLTLFSPEGDLPPVQSEMALRGSYSNNITMTPCTWLFNFKYNVDRDMGGEVNINLLKEKGVDFEKCAEMGIDHGEFGSVLQTSGLTTNDDVYWISFHSGYDFGYLLKAMQPSMMPNTEEEFIDNINEQFPNIWDVKFLYRKALAILQGRTPNTDIVLSSQATTILNNLAKESKNSLSEIGDELGLPRDIPRPNAALDSIHTGLVFWQMKQKIFGGEIDSSLMGGIWGLSQVGQPASAETRTAIYSAQQALGVNGAAQAAAPGLVKAEAAPGTPASSHGNLTSTPVSHGPNYGNMGNVVSGGGFGNFQYRQQ